MTTCSETPCPKPTFAKGLCSAHYFRQRRTGTTGTAPIKVRNKTRQPCRLLDCDTPSKALGLCRKHYVRYGHLYRADVWRPQAPPWRWW